jgi:hypothetical protein
MRGGVCVAVGRFVLCGGCVFSLCVRGLLLLLLSWVCCLFLFAAAVIVFVFAAAVCVFVFAFSFYLGC